MYWESGVRCDKIIVTWHRRRFYEQPYSMFDKFHEKSNLSKWSKGPEWATVLEEIGLQSPTFPPGQPQLWPQHRKLRLLVLPKCQGERQSSILRQTLLQTAQGPVTEPEYWDLWGRSMGRPRPAHSRSRSRTDADAKPCSEQQQTQWCDVKNVTCQNHVPGAPWE